MSQLGLVEQWRPLPWLEWSGYQVSDQGRVRGRRGGVLRPSVTRPWRGKPGGYLYVRLHNGRKQSKCWYVHRLVWAVFNCEGEIDDGVDVHHRNGKPTDNRLANLEGAPVDGHRGHKEYQVHGQEPEPVGAAIG